MPDFRILSILFVALCLLPRGLHAQENEIDRAAYLDAAREIMISARYCALITLDETGRAHVRTMDPFEPGEDLVVWMGTNVNSRKVTEIRNDSRVTLYYAGAGEDGYVAIAGIANIIDDPVETSKRWKSEWGALYSDRERGYTLLRQAPVGARLDWRWRKSKCGGGASTIRSDGRHHPGWFSTPSAFPQSPSATCIPI